MRASRHSRKSGSSYQPDDCQAIAGGDGRQIRPCEISYDVSVRRLHAGRHHRSGCTRNLFCAPGCAVEAAISLIDGKWKCVILFHLLDGTARFNELRRRIPGATQRTLTNQLRELELDGLIVREVCAQVRPKVEYSLSELGQTMEPVLQMLKNWGDANLHRFERSMAVAA